MASFLATRDGLIAQMIVLLLETEPEPGKGYYGIAIQAAEGAYRIKMEQDHNGDGERPLVPYPPRTQT